MKKAFSLVIMFGFFGLDIAIGQYYFFDSSVPSYPFQQGCSENLAVRVNTQSNPNGPVAGLLRLVFDPSSYSYNTSSIASVLQTNLFVGSTETFGSWTSPTGTPSWVDGAKTILQIDRNNGVVSYNGSAGLYGTINFVPKYSQSVYSGFFGMIYNGDTIRTSLSFGGINTIQPTEQNSRLTGEYGILQAPCIEDYNAPSITIMNPLNGSTKQFSSAGISFGLYDNGGFNGIYVPYIWTGGGVWTGNPGGVISNQYGIDLSSLQITLAGNSNSLSFVGNSFDTGNNLAALYAQPSAKTWQFGDKNYISDIDSGTLFDYGIEKPITLSVSVRDRKGLLATASSTFNLPQGPTLIAGSKNPVAGATLVIFDVPIRLGIQDDWAGVNSGSIRIRLSAVNGSGVTRGPYVFSGSDLNLSGVNGIANLPDQYININNHPKFPSSSTVTVHVDVQDMAGNAGNISDYTFSTRPSCEELGCCPEKVVQTKNIFTTLFTGGVLVMGGINPYYSGNDTEITGYIYCGLENNGLQIFQGDESDITGSTFVSYVESLYLEVAGNNVKAVLSGSTLYLSRLFEYGALAQGGGWGGGGTILIQDRCPSGDYSPSYYDRTCEGGEHGAALNCPVRNKLYNPEQIAAFQYAYSIGMTTMCPIERAALDNKILRKHLAKMLVEYGVKVIGLYPDNNKKGCDSYPDMTGESKEMQFYTKTVCQLDLMGLEADGKRPKKNFEPNELVDRGQFGTILSRLIFGYQYNLNTGEDQSQYYIHHLKALKDNGIIKNDNPKLLETRGYVMIMLKRTYDSGLVDENRMKTSLQNAMKALISGILVKLQNQ